MTQFQKAMVLLDMARDHLQDVKHEYKAMCDRDDIEGVIEDISHVLGVIESFSTWPNYNAEVAR